ncbi:serpin family protein [Candidatus Zixiibacteriota bacterium]
MSRLSRVVPISLALLFTSLLPWGAGAAQQGDLQAIAQRNAAFGFDLYRNLNGIDGNLFFSPYSISTALAMTWAGAQGRTEIEMREVLHFPTEQSTLHHSLSGLQNYFDSILREGDIRLHLANSLWYQDDHPFLESFFNLIESHYGAVLFPVDFVRQTEAVRRAINAWVVQETEDKIRELITPGLLDPTSVLVICNAIYFKGDWASAFDPEQTREAAFHVTPDREVTVPMMTGEAEFRSSHFDGFSALALPYEGHDLSMVILLPDEDTGIAGLGGVLTGERVSGWMRELDRIEPSRLTVQVPRFTTTSRFEMAEILMAMGMPSAFINADFSGMTGEQELFISEVVHQAFIEVNETGSEAAAATAVVMKRGGVMFIVDRPFLFLIRERNTGSILFIGRIVDPSQE